MSQTRVCVSVYDGEEVVIILLFFVELYVFTHSRGRVYVRTYIMS